MIITKTKTGYIARFWLNGWVNVLDNSRLMAIKIAIEYIDVNSK